MKSIILFDTNAILRYILQDNTDMANQVDYEINNNICFIPIEVIAEMIYVLSKVYKINRATIREAIQGTLEIPNISTSDNDLVFKAIDVYESTNLDFVDCLMVGYSKINNYKVFTFDKKLKKLL